MEKIMIIDSDAHQIRLLNDGLSEDYHVLGCNRGAKALELFRLYQPAALVLDPAMAELNGKAFIRKIRALPHRGRLPILAITRLTTLRHIEESFDWGVDAIFSKPCSAERVGNKLKKCLVPPVALRKLEMAGV